MKVLLQRVTGASVSLAGEVVGRIGRGLEVLVGVANGDTERETRYLAQKTVSLRIFPDEAGRFNLSARDIKGELLVVRQFTLTAIACNLKRIVKLLFQGGCFEPSKLGNFHQGITAPISG